MDYYKHESAYVDDGAQIGASTKIWHFSHIMPRACVGERCTIGQNVHVANDVTIGNNVKIQNNVSVYGGTTIEDDVFLGPYCVLTNVTNPRSEVVRRSIYETTTIKRGATIGANATIVCGVTIGRFAFVAAAAVVTKDIPDYGLVKGSPAKQTGWMSRHGLLLTFDEHGRAICPESLYKYEITIDASTGSERVRCLDIDENDPLPAEQTIGERSYRQFRKTS